MSREDLEQIDPDDPEEMDLQWEMAMLTIRARRLIKRTDRQLDVNGQRVRFDRSKVECYNCHKYGHFARECRLLRNQETRGKENNRRTMTVETPLKMHGLLKMELEGSSSSSNSEVDSCSKSCVKVYATLKVQYDSLSSDYKKSQFNLVSYKAEKFQNSSKSLNNLLEIEVSVKSKTGLGYDAASSTAATPAVERNFIPRKPDLTFMDEIVESENMDVTTLVTPSNVKKVVSNHESVGVKNNGDAVEPKIIKENSFRPPVIEDWNSDDDSEVEFIPNDKNVRPSIEKIKFVKSARETVEKVEAPKRNKHYPRGNQRNWNNLMSQILGSNFKMINKACFVCGSFEHLHYVCDKKVVRPVWNNSRRVNHKNFSNKMTHPHPKRSFVPQAVLTRTGKINIAGTNVNTAGASINTATSTPIMNHPRPKSNAFKRGYSQTVVSENKGKGANAVKASTCWVWKAKNSSGNPQQKEYKEKAVINSGCSRHMTGNKCYLDEYEDYDGGFVSFGDGKGIISRKAERKNRTLIEAVRTMLVDSKLLTTFWAKAVNTACYVLNRVLVIKPHNKTPYELIRGRPPLIDFLKPFGRPVTILNTRDHLCKIVEETLNIRFLENTPNVKGNGPDWLFDVDSLTISMNYVLVIAGNQTNGIAGTKDNIVAGQAQKEKDPEQEYILIPLCTTDPLISQGPKDNEGDAGMKPT
ncbi:ribonuclease H-like domain-containing protein [Tanacetum coccineum]